MLTAKFILAAFSAFIAVSAAPGAGAQRRQSEDTLVGRVWYQIGSELGRKQVAFQHNEREEGWATRPSEIRSLGDRPTPSRVGSAYLALQDQPTPRRVGSAYPAPRIGISRLWYNRLDIPKLNRERGNRKERDGTGRFGAVDTICKAS
ncbi:hypothetical protein C8J56DRAFT_1086004 [Mycena floridula]|nr:hypothetical protein C8J56DRAFT_1086004 [Mycena floridula]